MTRPIEPVSGDDVLPTALPGIESGSTANKESAEKSAQIAISFRTLLAVLGIVFGADMTLYSNHGFTPVALFLIAAPCLLVVGIKSIRQNRCLAIVSGALLLASIRLVWQGHAGLIAIGLCLVAAFAMSLHSLVPYIVDVFRFIVVAPIAGVVSLIARSIATRKPLSNRENIPYLAIGLPALATTIFATIFVMANPDLQSIFAKHLFNVWDYFYRWIIEFSVSQTLFWMLVAIVSFGFCFPNRRPYPIWPDDQTIPSAINQRSILFVPIRNMLVSVSMLFAIYLAYEFYTLWFQKFPEGFYYAGYAHEGAAWLTVALGLSTIVLSGTLRGDVLADPRFGDLRRLAWAWSALNLVLAVAVYHRLSIYIDFNGMTRMRTIGMFGVTCVLTGFVWVMLKIKHHRSFVWLVQRQLWTLAATAFLYLLTPVDMVVHAYNVRQILAGHLAPSVQITEHPLSDEGVLMLPPLLDCDDPTIREGIRALLAVRQGEVDIQREKVPAWVTYQGSTHLLQKHLDSLDGLWTTFKNDPGNRDKVYADFKTYAFQWY